MTDTVNPAVEGMIRSVHPEKVFDVLPGMTTANLAALYGLDETAYVALRDRFPRLARQAAKELLAEPPAAAALDALALSPGSAAGRWHRARQRRRSGYPTTMCLRVLSGVLLRHQPSWVVLSVGGNDALRYGAGAEKPLVSIAETARNLAELRRLVVSCGVFVPLSVRRYRIAGH